MEDEDIGTRYYGTTIDDPLIYRFGYGNESQNQMLSDDQVNQYLDTFREEYKDEADVTSDDHDDFLRSIGINPNTTMENWKSPSNAEIEKALQGDYNFSGLLNQYGKKAFDLFKDKNGNFDLNKLLTLGGGAYAASRPSGTTPSGYQGKIPKLTATSNMLTAPPVGRRPGSGGINYGGGVTYRDDKGNIVSSNEKTLEELRQAAINNPFNRGATYEIGKGLSASSLDELLEAMRPSDAAVATNTATNAANTANTAALASKTNASTLAALTAAINASKPAVSSAPTGITALAPRPTASTTSSETVALRQQLRDEYAAGPKTQEQLDKLLLKYPPAVMQAEFPEFGNVADYNNATREAYARVEQQQRIGNREAMRANAQSGGPDFIISGNDPNGEKFAMSQFPKMSAVPQAELAAARAKLTPEQAAFIDWQQSQINPMTHRRISEEFAQGGANPYLYGDRAQEQIDRANGRKALLSQSGVDTSNIAPWTNPNWQAEQKAKEDAERARMDQQRADWEKISPEFRPVVGPGGQPTGTGYGPLGSPMYTPPTAAGGILDWYNANVGRTDSRAQADLDNFLKNSGYTAEDISAALPQWGAEDLKKAGAPSAAPEVAAPAAPQQIAPAAPEPTPFVASPAPAPFVAGPVAAPADNWMSNLSYDASAAPQEFDWQKYVSINTDLGAAGIDTPEEALRHYQNYGQQEGRNLGLAKGGIAANGFVLPADVVSHFGNGSSEAGLKLLASKIGATPIKGEGDGMSDSIKTKIDGVQEARVANDEAYVSPEMVKKLGNGSPEKGARKLYAMMDQIREARTGTTKQGKQIDPNKYMPGGSVQRYDVGGTTKVPTGATGSESSLSNFAGDYVTNMLGQGTALANKPYEAYTGPLTAGASGLQNQAFGMASGLRTPGSIGQAAGTAGGIASIAPGAGQYTAVGSDFGASQAQQYMNPYLQSALNPAMDEARRQADISRMADAGRLTQAGAFGGSRQAIMESEGRRNLMEKQNQMLTSGYASAFDKAQQQFNADQTRKIQEQQFGTTSGLEGLRTSLQGAQAQAQAGALQSQADINNLRETLKAGDVERGIESEGIAADKAQFEEARLNPFKMTQFQQSLLSGLPLAAQSYTMPGQSNFQQFAGGATTIQQLLDILSGKTPPPKK